MTPRISSRTWTGLGLGPGLIPFPSGPHRMRLKTLCQMLPTLAPPPRFPQHILDSWLYAPPNPLVFSCSSRMMVGEIPSSFPTWLISWMNSWKK